TTAREFGGILLIDSKKGQGTNVSIFLPIADDQFKTNTAQQDIFFVPEGLQPEVLIVDDDLTILQTSRQILESSNLKCIVAENSKRAIDLFRQYQDSLKLVLIDSLMPGVN